MKQGSRILRNVYEQKLLSKNEPSLEIKCLNNTMSARVLQLDKQFIAVCKPHRVPSQPDISGDESMDTSVRKFLIQHYNKPGNAFVGVVHRLDRPCSGVTVFATTSKAASRLSEQFRDRLVKKHYLAVVESRNLGKRRGGLIKGEDEQGDLSWEIVKNVRNYAVLLVQISSGRKHQIRSQLAQAKVGPIIGDFKYGCSPSLVPSEFLFDNSIMLHASRISFSHPTKPEEQITISCPPLWHEDFWPDSFKEKKKTDKKEEEAEDDD